MSWGNRPTESAAPYVNELRYGCHAAPQECVDRYKTIAGIDSVAIAFAQAGRQEENIEKAKQYSSLSLQDRALKEIGVDDLLAFMKRTKTSAGDAYLDQLIDAAKSVNPHLKFGVTVYEDDIATIGRDSSTFPSQARGKVDRVALYLHFRKSAASYAEYVRSVKALFPNAMVYGGVYHYDRVDYIRCRQFLPGNCSAEDDLGAYSELLGLQVAMLKDKRLDGLELYPGFLGNEESWSGWSQSRICSPPRRNECVANSRKMTRATIDAIRNLR
ncbi:hypothetical protein [Variovorax sp.]|uniref:hypothetical protein n=1 Tax=Variovorax sp. TaxID=1871043 RepID=UPI002D35C896|nr:hypothetical protein [Variovorax sp.]HYP86208.1 hypothetical protein [Variovorax sp.]